LNNIDLTLTVSILTFGVFSTTIIELIYLNIDSINSPVQPSDSPTFTDTPPPTSSPFLPDSPARSSGNIVHNSTLDHLPGDVTYSFQEGDYSFVDESAISPNSKAKPKVKTKKNKSIIIPNKPLS
ncbi:3584_t:CDS:2, partial [Scutellospora calospora]